MRRTRAGRSRKLIKTKEKVIISALVCIALVAMILQPGSNNEALAVSNFKQPINMMYSFMSQRNFNQVDEMNGSIYHYFRSVHLKKKEAVSKQDQATPDDKVPDKEVKKEEDTEAEKDENNNQVGSEKADNQGVTQVQDHQDVNLQKVYLTFDDGPSAYTTSILESLNSHGMKATFFMLEPNMKKYPDELNQIINEGHVPALHGVTHDVSKIYRSEQTVVDEMKQGQATLLNLTGALTHLIRTPYGSAPYMKPSYKEAVQAAGFQLWDWTIDSNDWKYHNGEFVGQVIQQMENYRYKSSPIVILLHDRKSTAEYLPSLLKYLQSHGYETDVLNEKLSAYNF
ncbi:polysaccharide deacetylase family protein [Cytobacillus solani]|uniref:polysaccharide deacetylase family protein n=1 Tax=Cytobacillus solani TaxID=1637975 RepID=UPI0009EA0AFA|nr:polysaccharide deacetylase family protein [Cytobacillus solani]USK53247.1 polysaccharide deacetylase [Cytobacillus solani]